MTIYIHETLRQSSFNVIYLHEIVNVINVTFVAFAKKFINIKIELNEFWKNFDSFVYVIFRNHLTNFFLKFNILWFIYFWYTFINYWTKKCWNDNFINRVLNVICNWFVKTNSWNENCVYWCWASFWTTRLLLFSLFIIYFFKNKKFLTKNEQNVFIWCNVFINSK